MVFFRRKNSVANAPDSSSFEMTHLNHNLEPGDHVLRWTNLLLYPIQVHGIVLSAGAGMVTIIDFGLSADSGKANHIEELEQENRDRRLNIITLTEQKEVEQWKKVNYGGSLLSAGKWAKIVSWFPRKEERKKMQSVDSEETKESSAPGQYAFQMDNTDAQGQTIHESSSMVGNIPPPPPDEIFIQQRIDAEGLLTWLQQQEEEETEGDNNLEKQNSTERLGNSSGSVSSSSQTSRAALAEPATVSLALKNKGKEEEAKERKRSLRNAPPQLPKSDPPKIVLSRVRFLLSDEGKLALPSHHLLYANSECIAVWCKTGRFSTLQSQIFLHSTALGNAKTATTVALLVGAQTVTVTSTLPAAGFWGWLGFTTTTTSQVGLLSAQPWLIPVLAGYGIAAVGTPYLILLQARAKWERATSTLNDVFWQLASPDIYVDAIRHWNGGVLDD